MARIVKALNAQQQVLFVDGTDVIFTNKLNIVADLFSHEPSDMLFMTVKTSVFS